MDMRVNSCISLCMFIPLFMGTACDSNKLPCQPQSSSTLPEYLLTVLEEPAHSGMVCCVSYKKHAGAFFSSGDQSFFSAFTNRQIRVHFVPYTEMSQY